MTDTDITGLDDEALWDLIKDRLDPSHDWSRLLEGANAERLRALLTQQINVVNGQLASRNAHIEATRAECHKMGQEGRQRWFAVKAEHDQWRSKALHFKRIVERRLAEVRQVHDTYRRKQHAEFSLGERDSNRHVLCKLALAVAEHQRACHRDDLEPSAADLRLWGMLDSLTVPLGAHEASLSNMIDKVWFPEERPALP